MPRRIHRQLSMLFVLILVATVLLPVRTLPVAAATLPPPAPPSDSTVPAAALQPTPQTTIVDNTDQIAFVPVPLSTRTLEEPSAVVSQTPPSTAPALEIILEGESTAGERLHGTVTTPYGHQINYLNHSADGGVYSAINTQNTCSLEQPDSYTERITWATNPPPGKYRAHVPKIYSGSCSNVSYTLTILVNGEIIEQVSENSANYSIHDSVTLEYTLQPRDRNTPPEQCPCQDTNVGGPIDTRTGQSWTTATDLVVPGPGPALTWERGYVTRNTTLISTTVAPLGVGWQHGYGDRIFPDPAEPNVVSILTPKGNRFRYLTQGNGTFASFPGIFSTLVQANGVYTQTFRSHEQRVFNASTGKLTDIYDADGGHLHLTYMNGTLTQIADMDANHRRLDLAYTGDRLTSIQDGVGRAVTYTYITATNDLHQVFDVAGRPTTYLYQNHLLTGIDNALGQPLERTAYDVYTPEGKAISQTLLDGRQLTLSYIGSTTVLTTTAPTGEQEVETFVFGPQSTLRQRFVNGVLVQNEGTDGSFAPATRIDARGNQAHTTYTAKGQPLVIENALGQRTTFAYDARSNPITITDTLGRKTVYAYDLNNQVTRQTTHITTSLPLGITTIYTYSTQFPAQRIVEQLPTGLINTYGLDTTGQVITTTLGANTTTPQISVIAYDPTIRGRVLRQTTGYGTSHASTAQFDYDALGRVVTTTLDLNTAAQRQDITRYNLDDSVSETILNYQNGVYDPASPDADIVTHYGYDALGRQIWVRDPLGHYDVTHYDLVGRVDWTLRNLWPVTLDNQGEPLLPTTPPIYSGTRPDANIATLTAYDGLGRTTLVTQTGILTGSIALTTTNGLPIFAGTTTRVTRTQYDTLSRPITVTENYQPSINGGVFHPQYPDVNLQTLTQYDADGNIILERDTLGRWTYTEFDALNRPVTVTLNFEDGNPLTVLPAHAGWDNLATTDIIQVSRYTPDGRLERTIENYVAPGVFTATAPITNRITLYQYDLQGRVITTTLNYDPATLTTRTDTNLTTATAYDPVTGRRVGMQDASGRWTHLDYDAFGRVTRQVANCRTTAGIPSATDCAAFTPQGRLDRNVPSLTRYDALGQVQETEDVQGHVQRMTTDRPTRTTTMIQNYVPNTAPTTTTNVLSLQTVDALGRTILMTDTVVTTTTVDYRVSRSTYDALGRVQRTITLLGTTHYAYNALGNTVVMTDTAGRVSRSGYDGTGTLRWQQRHDGQLTIYHVDGMGRVTTTIQNYQNGVVDSGEPADQDIIMPTRYDAAGRQILTTDAGRRATVYTYTLLDQLTSVTENAASGTCTTAPCNVQTRYQYDRMGNRTTIIDALNRVRRFTYDAAGRQVTATDAANVTTAWSYDKLGRKTLQDDPRGANYDLTFAYDELDRMTQTLALNLSTPVQAQYDALGRRTQLVDASGTTTFTYNPLGYLTTVGRTDGSVGYAYSSRGERTRLRYPDGASIDYEYDGVGRLQQVRDATSTLATYGYDAAGRLDSLARLNGATTTYGYDAADRPVRQTTNAGTTLLSEFQYQLDPQGQRTVVTETLPLLTESSEMQSLGGMQSFMADTTNQDGDRIASPMANAASLESVNYLTPAADGQSLLATTSIYTATLSDQGVDLTLRGAAAAQADRTLAVRVHQLKRGTTTIALAAARPTRDSQNPNAVSLSRATGIREEQIAYAGGVKQNIVLEQPLAGSGDLEVRYHLTTKLEAQVMADQGLRFFRKGPGNTRQLTDLTMSPVVVYDAAGTQMTARVVLQGQQLIATIPDAFLAQAQYPLTIDPLIGTATTLSHGTSNPMPTAIDWWYSGIYLSVFSDARESATPRIYSQAFSANGDMLGEPGRVSTSTGMNPMVSPVLTATNRSLVVWQAPASGGHDILGRRLGLNQSLGTPFSITTGITDEIRPQVTSNPTAQDYLVVWSDGTDGAVRAQRISPSGSVIGTTITVFAAGTWDTQVQVTFNTAQQEYLVVAITSTSIIAQRLSATGSLISTPLTVTTLSGTPTRLLLAAASSSNQYLVAWDTASGISGRLISATGTLPGSVLTLASTSTTSLDPGQLLWNSTRQEFLLSWARPAAGTVEAQVLTSNAVPSGSAWTLATSTSASVASVRVALEPSWQRYGVIWHETSGEQRRLRGAMVTAATGAVAVGPMTIVAPRSYAEQTIIAYNSLDDSHLVVWQDVRGATTATLRLQRVAGDGTLQGTTWTLPLTMSVRASAPTLAFSPEGQNYLLAWQEDAADGTRMIRGAVISRTGQLMSTTPITITPAASHRITPNVAYNPDQEGYLVVWNTIHADGHRSVDGQRVSTNGMLVGSAIQVHSPTGTAPRIVYHPTLQQYLVVWMNPDINGRRLQGDGTPIGTVQSLTTTAARPCCGSVRLAVRPNSAEYVMVWGEHNRNNSGMHSTWARHIAANGTPRGPEIAVRGEIAGHWQTGQAIIADPVHDEYLILWAQNDVIYGQRINITGAFEGGVVTIASPPNVKRDPSGVARGTTGEAYLIWRSAEQSYGYGVVGQRYASPQASFTATAVAPVGTMAFSDTSTSPLTITSWLWTFGDGITSTLQHPTHVYSPTGLYTVTLNITSGTEWDLGTQVITVPNTLPTFLQTTVITYTYDGLSRLSDAERSTGEVYTYTYDLVGNRLSAWEEGVSRSWSYTVADQVVGWTYDAAGNLTNDGTQTYTYNAFNHMTGATPTSGPATTYAYNGDGVLLAQTTGTTTTSFTQDLQSPLSQMLAVNDGTTTTQYIYGHERLAEKAGSTRTWPIHDALGSVRATLDSTGLPLTATTYDPWGQPTSDAQPSPFGFTGEYQNQGLVYLRARWYQPGNGRFTGRDPFAGWSETPYSLHAYQYGYSDPVRNTDPTGMYICQEVYVNAHAIMPDAKAYNEFCLVKEAWLDTNRIHAKRWERDALGGLIELFSRPDLPGGQDIPRPIRDFRKSVTAAFERLDFILWYLAGDRDKHLSAAFDRVPFNDTGFAEEFRDSHYLGQNGEAGPSNQVQHFMAGMSVVMKFSDDVSRMCLIGHELYGQGGGGFLGKLQQCLFGVSAHQQRLFIAAASADEAGNSVRDCLLLEIMPDIPQTPYGPNVSAPPTGGRSLQDLRLSLKSFIFADKIERGEIQSLQQSRTWLITNMR